MTKKLNPNSPKARLASLEDRVAKLEKAAKGNAPKAPQKPDATLQNSNEANQDLNTDPQQ